MIDILYMTRDIICQTWFANTTRLGAMLLAQMHRF